MIKLKRTPAPKFKASDFFSTLPPEVKRRAVKNMKRNYLFGSLSEAIYGAFSWSHTPEGARYWKNKYNHYKALEKPVPKTSPYRMTLTNWFIVVGLILIAILCGCFGVVIVNV